MVSLLQGLNRIGKNGFRSIVQQLTGSPLREHQNTRLQKIRPVALAQINQPHVMAQPTHDLAPRPPMQSYMHSLPHVSQPMMCHGDQFLSNTAESPDSVYMHYLKAHLEILDLWKPNEAIS